MSYAAFAFAFALALPLIIAAGLIVYVALFGRPTGDFHGEFGEGL